MSPVVMQFYKHVFRIDSDSFTLYTDSDDKQHCYSCFEVIAQRSLCLRHRARHHFVRSSLCHIIDR